MCLPCLYKNKSACVCSHACLFVSVGTSSGESAARLTYQRYWWNVPSWRGASARCDPSCTVCSCPRRASSSVREDHNMVLQWVSRISSTDEAEMWKANAITQKGGNRISVDTEQQSINHSTLQHFSHIIKRDQTLKNVSPMTQLKERTSPPPFKPLSCCTPRTQEASSTSEETHLLPCGCRRRHRLTPYDR